MVEDSHRSIKVSVRLICYNQEKFIAQAIESILMQKVDFDYNIVVGDDLSTDGTMKVINRYAENHPEVFKILERKGKVGRLRNFAETIENCKGEYIALLDGDDYWTDPYKLQKQVDFLDRNREFVMCYTDYSVCDEEGNLLSSGNRVINKKSSLDPSDILRGSSIIPSIFLFRNYQFSRFPEEFFTVFNADTFLYYYLTNYGKAKYLDDITTMYRVHGDSVWSSAIEEAKITNNMNTKMVLLRVIDKKNKKYLIENINHNFMSLCLFYRKNKQYLKFLLSYSKFGYFDIKHLNLRFLKFAIRRLLSCYKENAT